jgi:hypothetical protein
LLLLDLVLVVSIGDIQLGSRWLFIQSSIALPRGALRVRSEQRMSMHGTPCSMVPRF